MLPVEYLNEVSCFESLRAYRGNIFCFDSHLDRLEDSCEGIGKSLPLSKKDLKRWITGALGESGFRDAVMRFSVHWHSIKQGICLIIIREFLGYPNRWYKNGVHLSTAVAKRWSLRAQNPQIKASTYVSGVLTTLDQQKAMPHEFIFLNELGFVAEGSISNLFIINPAHDIRSVPVIGGVKSKRILTPSISSGILRGVTRGTVIDLAKKRDMEVVETFLTRHDIYSAEECFMANTSSEVLPVVSVDGRTIANGKPGWITNLLARDFRTFVKENNQ